MLMLPKKSRTVIVLGCIITLFCYTVYYVYTTNLEVTVKWKTVKFQTFQPTSHRQQTTLRYLESATTAPTTQPRTTPAATNVKPVTYGFCNEHIHAMFEVTADAGNNTSKNRVKVYKPLVARNETRRGVTLNYNGGSMRMYVHNFSDTVTNSIVSTGAWEREYVDMMVEYLHRYPNVHLIDIGCNLGVYTLVASATGRQAVAVDANIENIRLLGKSVAENKLDDRVTIVHNAISNIYTNVTIKVEHAENIGSGFIVKSGPRTIANVVQSIYLNDLLEVIPFRKAVIKVDIQCHEYFAFQKADQLFREMNIFAVQLEWGWVGKTGVASISEFFTNFFLKNGFKPYADFRSTVPLVTAQYLSWPFDIVWKKLV